MSGDHSVMGWSINYARFNCRFVLVQENFHATRPELALMIHTEVDVNWSLLVVNRAINCIHFIQAGKQVGQESAL